MRILAVFGKTMREMRRDLAVLLLTLAFAPAFVGLYRAVFPSLTVGYKLVVLDRDRGATTAGGQTVRRGRQLIAALRDMKNAEGKPPLRVREVASRDAAVRLMENRDADALMMLPAALSRSLEAGATSISPAPATVTMVGDLSSPSYGVAMTLALAGLQQYVQTVTGQSEPVRVAESPMGGSGARTDFELYIPGLLVFAVVLLVFLAAMTVAREAESGTLRRLQITRMTSFDLLGGTSAALMLVGTVGVALTFVTAWALGFRSQGPLWVALVVGALTSLSVVGVGLVVACFSRTVAQAFVIANFPLGLLMFFTGVILPLPRMELFSVAGHGVSPFDILPPTHAVIALSKVLTLGRGLGSVTYELGALAVLSLLYLGLGAWLFKRLRMRAA